MKDAKVIEKKDFEYKLSDLSKVVDYLYAQFSKNYVFTFSGPLGAGKTTLIRALLKKCGVKGPITSPTFTYVNIYHNAYHQTFYHFDLYRVNTINQFFEAGFDEYLYVPQSWAFIEWPEVIMPLLTHNVCHAVLDYYNNGRILHVSYIE